MRDLTDEIDVDEDGKYRYRDYTGEDGVYAAVPFLPEGQLIWYPPEAVERAVEHETWSQFLVVTAGGNSDSELRAEVYLNRSEYREMGVMRFTDPEDSFAVVADIDAVQDMVRMALTSDGWKHEYVSPWLTEMIDKCIWELKQ